MKFFLDRTLPQFNQAGAKLDWGWPEMFLEFENVLGDSLSLPTFLGTGDHAPHKKPRWC